MEKQQQPTPQEIKVVCKIIKLINGDDIVSDMPIGKSQLPDNQNLLRIIKPLQIRYVPQLTPYGVKDYIALIKWTGYSNDHVVTIPKDKIMTITNATKEMTQSYRGLASGYDKLDVPQNKKDERKRLTAEENARLNEIFDEEVDFPMPNLGPKRTLH